MLPARNGLKAAGIFGLTIHFILPLGRVLLLPIITLRSADAGYHNQPRRGSCIMNLIYGKTFAVADPHCGKIIFVTDLHYISWLLHRVNGSYRLLKSTQVMMQVLGRVPVSRTLCFLAAEMTGTVDSLFHFGLVGLVVLLDPSLLVPAVTNLHMQPT